MTRKGFIARAILAKNLADEAEKLRKFLIEETGIDCFAADYNTEGFVWPDCIEDDGEALQQTSVKVVSGTVEVEISKQTRGGKLTASTGEGDYGTSQIWLGYEYQGNDAYFDLALAEVKGGAIAEYHGMAPDNKDIQLYAYEDLFEEDFTHGPVLFRYGDIEKAANI